jgi:hypothetical protein
LRPPAPSRFGTASAPAGYFRLLIDCLPRPLRAPLNACCRAKPSSLRTAAPAAPRLVVRPGAPPDTQPRLSPMPICPRAYGSAGTGVLRRDADAHARPLALERGRLARRPASGVPRTPIAVSAGIQAQGRSAAEPVAMAAESALGLGALNGRHPPLTEPMYTSIQCARSAS